MLFFLVLMRMSGFIFLNPILGRRNIPATAKTGLSLGLAVIVFSMEQSQGITEQLKTENTLEWVQRMNNIQACAREIVNEEIIFA